MNPYEQLEAQLEQDIAQAEALKAKVAAAKKKHEEMMNLAKNAEALESQMAFNVGGTLFYTTKETLLRVKDSYFTCMLESGNWKPQPDGAYFIDRDATCFGRILNYLRYDELDTVGLSVKQTKMLQADLDYFFPNEQWHMYFSLCSGHMYTLKDWLGDDFDATKLLWRGSRDGFTSKSFHNHCDNKGATLTVIKSTNDWIFGGYNPSNWASNDSWSNGSGSFLFTLTNPNGIPPTQYLCRDQDYAAYNSATFGPAFGNGHDLAVSEDGCTGFTKFPVAYTDTDTTGVYNATFTRKKRFDVKEIEVYAI